MTAYLDGTRGQPETDAQYAAEDSLAETSRATTNIEAETPHNVDPTIYRVYRIRWFGLFQLILLNIIVSWDVSLRQPPLSLHQAKHTLADHRTTVALLLPRRQHSSDLLLHHRERHQLALHGLPLRLRRRLARNYLCPLLWRSPPFPHHRFALHPPRQLDPLCRHTLLPTPIRRRHVRANP